MTGIDPQWIRTFLVWMYPSALVLAAVLPFSRALIRKCRNSDECFLGHFFVHDLAGGLTIPSFMALCLAPMFPEVWEHLQKNDGHAVQLAGMLGMYYSISSIFAPEKPPKQKPDGNTKPGRSK